MADLRDPRWNNVAPWETSIAADPAQDPIVASQYGLTNPFEGLSMPSMPQGAGNTALNLAGILGGLGLGLARPRVAPQALQNFQAANTMQWREDQKEMAQQRLAIAQREHDIQVSNFLKMQEPEGGQPQASRSFATPPPQMAQAPAPPQTSAVPHFAAPQMGGLSQPMQFRPEERMASPPDQPFLSGPPQPIRGNTSTNLSALGQSQTRSTNRGTEKEQATNNAVNELTTAWVQNPDLAQRDPRRLLKEVLGRNPQADSREVRQSLSNTLFETYHTATLQNQPDLDPKSAYRQAYSDASRDLGAGLFLPTDAMRTLATQISSEGEHRGLAIGKDDTRRLGTLNTYEGNQAAAVQGAKNTADFFTKPYSPSDATQFERPPVPGTTPAMQSKAGIAPMSTQRQTNVTTAERERTQRVAQLEAVAPSIASVVQRAEQIRKGFSDLTFQNLAQKGKNWLDIAQSQLTGLPQTELGKLVTSYDDMVDTSSTFMAKAVQGQVGNLTEQERRVGAAGFPKTFRELVNSPVAGNDRLAVLGTVLAMELRDPTFELGRLDMPMSEFEKSVRAHRQHLIQTRPEIFTNAPQLAPTTQAPGMAAPPSMPSPMMTPEDKAVSDRIQQELGDYFKANPRQK